MIRKFAAFVAIIFLTQSCGLTDNESPLPFFLDLSSPSVKAVATFGNDTHKITDVWVFADGQILGVFPLPATVPVTLTGKEQEITILAGIRNNGMNDQPVFYPFYQSIVKKLNPAANEHITIPLDFKYVDNAKIPINEGFENTNSFSLDIDNKPETFIYPSTSTAILGKYSGEVTLNSSLSFVEVANTQPILAGDNSRGESYIEFDYKGDGEIAVGLAKFRNGTINIEYFLFVPGKANWNKIYVEVTDKLSSQDYEKYLVLLAFSKTGNSQESKIYVDNYKHVHF
jgi:hypothetical protein